MVIDTNIWLDMLVFDDPRTRRLAALLPASPAAVAAPASVADPQPRPAAGVRALSTPEMRAELTDVISRSLFKLGARAQEALLSRYDELVTPAPVALDCRLSCRDPDDRKFLDLAVGAHTDWLLSRDRALLACRKHARDRFDLRIGEVGDFYTWLDGR